MKNFIKTSRKWLLALVVCLSLSTVGTICLPAVVHADELESNDIIINVPGKYDSVQNIGNSVTSTLSAWKGTLVSISIAGFPCALIAMILLIMFSKDPKKVSGLIGVCVTMTIAFGAILLVNAGALVEIIKSIING